jgi:mandelate racemase
LTAVTTIMHSPLTIESVDVRCVLVPLKRTPVLRHIPLPPRWPIILIDLHMREGVVGRSYLQPYLPNGPRYIAPVIHDLVERFRGKPANPVDLFQPMRRGLSPLGLQGVTLAAVSGLDMAIWDALAKAAQMPLARYLGGSVGPVKAYNSNGLWLIDPADVAREAQELIAQGQFTALKIRLGRNSLAQDVAAIAAARRAGGEALQLMADFSQVYAMGEAIERCRALDGEGLYWIEEPIACDNLSGRAQLRRRLATPIQVGENFWGPRDLEIALELDATDFVMPDLMRIGGVTGWMRAAGIAAGKGVPVSTHLYPEFSAHLMRVTETAHWLEWCDWADVILAEPFELRNGEIHIPERPGSGIQWNESAISQYAHSF